MPEQSVKDQIEDMLSIGAGTEAPATDPVVTNAPGTDPVATEPPGTSAPETNVPSTDAPKTSAPVTKAPGTTAPTTEAPVDETEELRKENERLRKRIEEGSGRTKAPSTKAPSTDAPIEDINFLDSDTDLDDITRNVETFNKVLNKVYKAGVESQRGFQEDTLRSIPNIVKSNVIIQATLKKKVDGFYKGNKDLLPFKRAVGQVYEELASENPDWNLDKVFVETEKEARVRLELPRKASTTEAPTTGAPKGPRFAKTKSRKTKSKPDTSGLLSEIDEMNRNIQ